MIIIRGNKLPLRQKSELAGDSANRAAARLAAKIFEKTGKKLFTLRSIYVIIYYVQMLHGNKRIFRQKKR